MRDDVQHLHERVTGRGHRLVPLHCEQAVELTVSDQRQVQRARGAPAWCPEPDQPVQDGPAATQGRQRLGGGRAHPFPAVRGAPATAPIWQQEPGGAAAGDPQQQGSNGRRELLERDELVQASHHIQDLRHRPAAAAQVAAAINSDPETALRFHMREELGVDPSALPSPLTAAVASLVSCALGGLVPLLPFKLLADGTRLRLLLALAGGGERDVTDLCETVGVAHPLASQHLARLRRGGAVTARREGRQVFYSLSGGHMRRLVSEALFHADHTVTGTGDHD